MRNEPAYHEVRLTVPRRMYRVDVRVWRTDAGLQRAYRREPGPSALGQVAAFAQSVDLGHVRIHLSSAWTLSDLVHEAVHCAILLREHALPEDDKDGE